jgi:hypothetical protein
MDLPAAARDRAQWSIHAPRVPSIDAPESLSGSADEPHGRLHARKRTDSELLRATYDAHAASIVALAAPFRRVASNRLCIPSLRRIMRSYRSRLWRLSLACARARGSLSRIEEVHHADEGVYQFLGYRYIDGRRLHLGPRAGERLLRRQRLRAGNAGLRVCCRLFAEPVHSSLHDLLGLR